MLRGAFEPKKITYFIGGVAFVSLMSTWMPLTTPQLWNDLHSSPLSSVIGPRVVFVVIMRFSFRQNRTQEDSNGEGTVPRCSEINLVQRSQSKYSRETFSIIRFS